MNANILPKKSLGQHFLHDKNIARKIVNLLDISAQDLIIEIGPGLGVLTQFFCDQPAKFILIELDSRCIDVLNKRFAPYKNISIIRQDILSFFLRLKRCDHVNLKWIGNLPYHITSPVLFRLLDLYPFVHSAVFMVQHEVARRMVANHGSKDYGILSVLMQSFYHIIMQFKVSRTVFKPQPNVDSAVVSLHMRTDVSLDCEKPFYQQVVKTAFNQRRKQLKNSLQDFIDKTELEKIPFDFSKRAEQIPIQEWKTLCQHLEKKKNYIRAINGLKQPLKTSAI